MSTLLSEACLPIFALATASTGGVNGDEDKIEDALNRALSDKRWNLNVLVSNRILLLYSRKN